MFCSTPTTEPNWKKKTKINSRHSPFIPTLYASRGGGSSLAQVIAVERAVSLCVVCCVLCVVCCVLCVVCCVLCVVWLCVVCCVLCVVCCVLCVVCCVLCVVCCVFVCCGVAREKLN
jgi:hypothetical protein